jgi:hypothetical protein
MSKFKPVKTTVRNKPDHKDKLEKSVGKLIKAKDKLGASLDHLIKTLDEYRRLKTNDGATLEAMLDKFTEMKRKLEDTDNE